MKKLHIQPTWDHVGSVRSNGGHLLEPWKFSLCINTQHEEELKLASLIGLCREAVIWEEKTMASLYTNWLMFINTTTWRRRNLAVVMVWGVLDWHCCAHANNTHWLRTSSAPHTYLVEIRGHPRASFPSTLWVQGFKLKLLGLVAGIFTS